MVMTLAPAAKPRAWAPGACFRDRLADSLYHPGDVPGLQRKRSDACRMHIAREFDDAICPVDVAWYPVVHPHQAIRAILDTGAAISMTPRTTAATPKFRWRTALAHLNRSRWTSPLAPSRSTISDRIMAAAYRVADVDKDEFHHG